MLDEEARKARNQYVREWRAANKQKVKEANQRYWAKRAARLAAARKEQVRE